MKEYVATCMGGPMHGEMFECDERFFEVQTVLRSGFAWTSELVTISSARYEFINGLWLYLGAKSQGGME